MKNKISLKFLRKIPAFWSHVLLIGMMMPLFIAVLLASNRYTEKTVSDKLLREIERDLEWQTETLGDDLRKAYGIPLVLQQSEGYKNLLDRRDKPEYSYVSLLSGFQDVLGNLLYLHSNAAECIAYYAPRNFAVCSSRMSYMADEFLTELSSPCEKLNTWDLREALDSRNSQVIFPLDKYYFDNQPQDCLAVVFHPQDCDFAVLSLYTAETVAGYFTRDLLEAGACLTLRDASGSVLADYGEMPEGEAVTVEAGSVRMGLYASLTVPESYFKALLKGTRSRGMLMTAAVAVLGLAYCFLLSATLTEPIHSLLQNHDDEAGKDKNEYRRLAQILKESRNREEEMERRMQRSLVIRVLSGNLLPEQDEARLADTLSRYEKGYRVAIFHCVQEVNRQLKEVLLGDEKPEDYLCEIISNQETGLVFPGDAESLAALEHAFRTLEQMYGQEDLALGISAIQAQPDNFHVALRQAYAAMPEKHGMQLYKGFTPAVSSPSWLQLERLYQSLLSRDENQAMQVMKRIFEETHSRGVSREFFLSIRMMLRSVAQELGMEMTFQYAEEYEPGLAPSENILRAEKAVKDFFSLIRERQEQASTNKEEKIFEWIENNCGDCNLSAAYVAAMFDVPEKRVYELAQERSGMSFRKYVLSLRMKRAVLLLCGTGSSVEEVAVGCGYPAISTFYRVFKQYYGVTPIECRNSGGVSGPAIREKEKEKVKETDDV